MVCSIANKTWVFGPRFFVRTGLLLLLLLVLVRRSLRAAATQLALLQLLLLLSLGPACWPRGLPAPSCSAGTLGRSLLSLFLGFQLLAPLLLRHHRVPDAFQRLIEGADTFHALGSREITRREMHKLGLVVARSLEQVEAIQNFCEFVALPRHEVKEAGLLWPFGAPQNVLDFDEPA